eukprot:scaffold105965_cov63-Phaeocystis_antarctica.AAC.3
MPTVTSSVAHMASAKVYSPGGESAGLVRPTAARTANLFAARSQLSRRTSHWCQFRSASPSVNFTRRY